MKIAVRCVMCHTDHVVDVPRGGFFAWKRGAFIQDAMPEVSPDDRELLISKICGDCFEATFGEAE